jgi:glycosyltransferase involved in cell wall biosynthesis
VKKAALIATVSEATRNDLSDRYGVSPARIRVVPNGVDRRFFAPAPLSDQDRCTLRLPAEFLLMVGTLEPRKNHLNVFKALRQLDDQVDLPLVVAGRRGWAEKPILDAAEPLIASGRLHLIDYVPEQWLPGLYASAAAVLYPSWYEGFGLPVAESLAAGTPVVASTTPALMETGGEVALYADPGSPDSIAASVIEALSSASQSPEARRNRRAWAERFNWEQSGAILASSMRELLATG